MKVLLDEDLDHRLRKSLDGHEVFTVRYLGWAGLKNGELLVAAEQGGMPVFLNPLAASSGTSPSGIFHLMTPSFRSYAVREVHGGAIDDSPLPAIMNANPLTWRSAPALLLVRRSTAHYCFKEHIMTPVLS